MMRLSVNNAVFTSATFLVALMLLARVAPADEAANPMSYQGKSVDQWARDLSSDDDETKRQTIAALLAIGEPSVPALREILRDESNPKRRGLAITISRRLGVQAKAALPELMQCLTAKEYFIRGWSSRAIGAMGPEGKQAVPALVASLKTWDHDSKGHAFSALADIGPAAAPALIKLMNEGDEDNSRLATSALGRIQPRVDEVVRELEETMRGTDARLRVEAAFAHWRMTKQTDKATRVLGDSLGDSDRIVRHCAALSFLQMGAEAREAAEALQRLAKDEPDATIRSFAVRTLKAIETSGTENSEP